MSLTLLKNEINEKFLFLKLRFLSMKEGTPLKCEFRDNTKIRCPGQSSQCGCSNVRHLMSVMDDSRHCYSATPVVIKMIDARYGSNWSLAGGSC